MLNGQVTDTAMVGTPPNRKRRFAVLAGAVAACIVAIGGANSTAQGAVVYTITDLGAPTINGTTVFTGFEAYDLTLSTNDGGTISAVDFGGTAAGATRGFFGPFLQRATLVTDPDTGTTTRTLTPQEPQKNSSGSSFSLDTHFLPASRTDVASPNEDNNGTNPAGGPADNSASDYGTGSFLNGTFGIPAATQAATLDLAYIILPVGQVATFSGLASENGASSPIVGTIGSAAVPEPASIALLGLGALGVLSRKRRA